MKKYLFKLFLLIPLLIIGQNQFFVSPNGQAYGDGSINNPWDLQTALSQSPKIISGGDTVWLLKGVYNGRYISSLRGEAPQNLISVKPYNNEKVVLNGNVESKNTAVLEVRGEYVMFKNVDITFLGDFSRDVRDENFQKVAGISHNSGQDCQFIGLKIYNIPGTGFGSWKKTGGSIIEDCVIYNNGYMSTKRGSGVGIYVQNESENLRLIKNNIVFNNYYKGIEVWSASSGKKFEFVKNVTLVDNIMFNNGNPGGIYRDNIIVATDDKEGINVAKNITIDGNILYHNTNFVKNQVNGNAASLTIGFNKNAPAKNIVVNDNVIVGRNNALRLLYAQNLKFQNNKVYSGYVFQTNSTYEYSKNWDFGNNRYFTKKRDAFRIKDVNISLENWRSKFKLDKSSQWQHIKEFDLKPVLKLTKINGKIIKFNVALFKKDGSNVLIDFSKYKVSKNTKYKIYDVENLGVVLKSGKISKHKKIEFTMNSIKFERPLHNTTSKKTLSNFGVFVIEFENSKKSLFSRIFE